jgi:hypothetical protein
MNLRIGKLVCLTLVALCLGRSTLAAEVEAQTNAGPSKGFWGSWIANRLSIGGDWTHFSLDDTRRYSANGLDNYNITGNFLGSLWGLDAKQHGWPSPFLEYRVFRAFGLGAAYDERRAMTLDWADDTKTVTVGDGDVELRGLQVYAFGQLSNRTRLVPYANVGHAHYWSHFFTLPSWSQGIPGHVIEVDATGGWFFSLGTRVKLVHGAALNTFYRRLFVDDVPVRAYADIINRPDHHRDGHFPMSGNTLGLGLTWAF